MASTEINSIYNPPSLGVNSLPAILTPKFHKFLKLITSSCSQLATYEPHPLYVNYMKNINNNILLLTGCRLRDTVLTIKRRDNYAYSNRALW